MIGERLDLSQNDFLHIYKNFAKRNHLPHWISFLGFQTITLVKEVRQAQKCLIHTIIFKKTMVYIYVSMTLFLHQNN